MNNQNSGMDFSFVSEIEYVKVRLASGERPSQIANSLHAQGLHAIPLIYVFRQATGASIHDLKTFGQWWGNHGVTNEAAFDAYAARIFPPLLPIDRGVRAQNVVITEMPLDWLSRSTDVAILSAVHLVYAIKQSSTIITAPYWIITRPLRRRTSVMDGRASKRYFEPLGEASTLEWILAVAFGCVLLYLVGAVIQHTISMMLGKLR